MDEAGGGDEGMVWKRAPDLGKLRKLALCPLCKGILQDPHKLRSCNCVMCKECLEERLWDQSVCPDCGLPALPQDMKPSQLVGNIVRSYQGLEKVYQAHVLMKAGKGGGIAAVGNSNAWGGGGCTSSGRSSSSRGGVQPDASRGGGVNVSESWVGREAASQDLSERLSAAAAAAETVAPLPLKERSPNRRSTDMPNPTEMMDDGPCQTESVGRGRDCNDVTLEGGSWPQGGEGTAEESSRESKKERGGEDEEAVESTTTLENGVPEHEGQGEEMSESEGGALLMSLAPLVREDESQRPSSSPQRSPRIAGPVPETLPEALPSQDVAESYVYDEFLLEHALPAADPVADLSQAVDDPDAGEAVCDEVSEGIASLHHEQAPLPPEDRSEGIEGDEGEAAASPTAPEEEDDDMTAPPSQLDQRGVAERPNANMSAKTGARDGPQSNDNEQRLAQEASPSGSAAPLGVERMQDASATSQRRVANPYSQQLHDVLAFHSSESDQGGLAEHPKANTHAEGGAGDGSQTNTEQGDAPTESVAPLGVERRQEASVTSQRRVANPYSQQLHDYPTSSIFGGGGGGRSSSPRSEWQHRQSGGDSLRSFRRPRNESMASLQPTPQTHDEGEVLTPDTLEVESNLRQEEWGALEMTRGGSSSSGLMNIQRSQRVGIVTSGVDDEDKYFLSELLQSVGREELRVYKAMNANVTHLVLGKKKTTVTDGLYRYTDTRPGWKYVMALGMGLWIVSIDWVKRCLCADRPQEALLLPPMHDELVGGGAEGCNCAPKQARMRMCSGEGTLFKGVYIHLVVASAAAPPGSILNGDVWCALIKDNGGSATLHRQGSASPLAAVGGKSRRFVVLLADAPEEVLVTMAHKVCQDVDGQAVVKHTWLCNCFTSQRVQAPTRRERMVPPAAAVAAPASEPAPAPAEKAKSRIVPPSGRKRGLAKAAAQEDDDCQEEGRQRHQPQAGMTPPSDAEPDGFDFSRESETRSRAAILEEEARLATDRDFGEGELSPGGGHSQQQKEIECARELGKRMRKCGYIDAHMERHSLELAICGRLFDSVLKPEDEDVLKRRGIPFAIVRETAKKFGRFNEAEQERFEDMRRKYDVWRAPDKHQKNKAHK